MDVPTNAAAPVNVTVPDETEYAPSPDTDTEVLVQFGAVSPDPQSLMDDTFRVVPAVAVSFDAGVSEMAVSIAPDFESGRAVGGSAHWNTIIP